MTEFIQYFLSKVSTPFTPEQRAVFPELADDAYYAVATVNDRELVHGIVPVDTDFAAILAYLIEIEHDPVVLMCLNQDGSDKTFVPEGATDPVLLFTPDMAAYEAFFTPSDVVIDGETVSVKNPQHRFFGWALPGEYVVPIGVTA
jgi:hypothetical protein